MLPTTWDEALKGAAESKLQHAVATHEKALLWRDLYRGQYGSDQEDTEYKTLMEELDIVGAGDAVTSIPSTTQFQLEDWPMAVGVGVGQGIGPTIGSWDARLGNYPWKPLADTLIEQNH